MPLNQPVVGAAAAAAAPPRRPLRSMLRFSRSGSWLVLAGLCLTLWLTVYWGILPRIERMASPARGTGDSRAGGPVRIGRSAPRAAAGCLASSCATSPLLDAQQRPALQLPRVEARLSPAALLAFELRFDQLLIEGPQLEIRRDARAGGCSSPAWT